MLDSPRQPDAASAVDVACPHIAEGRGRPVRDAGEQDATLQALFENTTAGVAEIDAASGLFLRVNRRYCQITGRTAAELLGGLGIHDVLHPGDDRVAISVAEERGDAERRYLLPDGQVAWVWISVAVTARDVFGNALRISAVVQDVTESHAAQERLRASEALLRLSLQVGQVGCFTRDVVTGDIHCGAETRSMHGFPPGDAPIPTAAWLAAILPEDRSDLQAAMRAATADRLPEAGYEYRFRHPLTGEIRHIEVRTRYEYDAQGRPLTSLGAIIDVTRRRQAEARITYLAFHDTLTGLPNRTQFRQRLEAALGQAKGGRDVAVLYLDLDCFKDVNDTQGHSMGDALLREVATRLQSAMDRSCSIARLGGDEFAIIQCDREQPRAATALARRLGEALGLPFTLDGHRLAITTSIGVALAPRDGPDADTILKAADLALYGAKAEGRGRFRFFEPAMSNRAERRRALALDLRRALAEQEFEVHYQPILRAGTLEPVALEALLRWRHPERGMVLPDDFIPLAEELGLIVPMGEWVMARACADAATWPGGVRVAVNLSAVQLDSRDLAANVATLLERSGLGPDRLELEITETVMLQESDATMATLHRIKAMGVRVALDDFGTGYSSLSYLRSFPFDKVKIDRSFTRGLGGSPQGTAIMRAVLDLCAGLGMTTTVEGVETAEQLRAVTELGGVEVQGFLFSRAVPACQVRALLAELEV